MQLSSHVLDVVLKNQDKTRREVNNEGGKENKLCEEQDEAKSSDVVVSSDRLKFCEMEVASLASEIRTLSSAVEGRNYPMECEKRLAERARAIQAKMDSNLQTIVAQEQTQQEVEDDQREKGPEGSHDDDSKISTIRSRLQELRRGLSDRTPNRSPSRNSNARIGHFSNRSLPPEPRSNRSSLEVPAASGTSLSTSLLEECGPRSRCGVAAHGREAQPLRRISSGYIDTLHSQSPPKRGRSTLFPGGKSVVQKEVAQGKSVAQKEVPQGIPPPSPVPGSRKALEAAALTEGTQNSALSASSRSLSARSVSAKIPPVPLVGLPGKLSSSCTTGCLARENVVSETISEESTGLSITTRSSRGSPGVSLQAKPGPDQSLQIGSSWQFQAGSQEHLDVHQHVQHHVLGGGPSISRMTQPLPKAPSQWRAQPGQVQAQGSLQTKRRPSLVLSMSHGPHSQTQSANTSPRQSMNVRLSSPSSTATQQVPSPRPWGMRPPGCSAEVQVTWHGHKLPRQLSGSIGSHQQGTSLHSRTNSVC